MLYSMGKTNKKRSEYYFGSHSFKDAKQRRNRSIRTRNNSKAIEDFTTYPKKFQYPSKIRKVQQEENLINTNDFNPARCRITCGDYNYNTCNYSYEDYCNKEINNNWQLTRLDNNSTLNNLKKHEDLYMQKYAKIKLKQIKRRGKSGIFNGHHKDKCYETILNDIM